MEFDWDEHNREKNKVKHNVDFFEAEDIFFNRPLITFQDIFHSQKEDRYIAMGMTDAKRLLVIVYTTRNNKIRIISARNQNKKEREYYQLHVLSYEENEDHSKVQD